MADRLHLSPRHRSVLEALLHEHLPDVEAWAYGSRVNGRSHDGSDLDLALRGPGLKKIPAGQLADFRDAVRESTIPFLVEARDWAGLPERFHREIQHSHAAIVCPKAGSSSPMQSYWRNLPLSQAVVVNPPVQLERGRIYPYVDMAQLTPGIRSVGAVSHREWRGGGSRFEAGDTLMARITPCLENGKTSRFESSLAEAHGPAHGSTEFIVLRGRPNVSETGFVYYLAKWAEVQNFAMSQMTGTSGRQRVPANCFEHFPVSIPPIAEQRPIARILGALDDKIELNRRMNETLEAMARALFKSWFVDFEPVRAKAVGRDTGLPQSISRLFPDRFMGSDLGDVPDGWHVTCLSDMMDVNPRRSGITKGDKAPYVPMAAMPTTCHTPTDVVDRPFGSGMRFINGDTLVARITPCLENGKTAYVDFLREGQVGWGSTEYIVLRPIAPFPCEFAYFLARSTAFRDFAIRNMTGTSGRQRVQASTLAKFPLALPPPQLLREFGKHASPLLAQANSLARLSRTLATIRDALLPKLISGQICVPQAERAVAAVL